MSGDSKNFVLQENVDWMDDLPMGGDLEKYRKTATFNWKQLRMILEDPDRIRLKAIIDLINIRTDFVSM